MEGKKMATGKGGGDENATKKPKLEISAAHEGGGGAIVAAGPGSGAMKLDVDVSVLRCTICFRPLKPPVFECKGGHTACESCVAEIPDKRCQKCEQGGGFERCLALEKVVSSMRIECAHDGCGSLVTYHEADEHQSAPCSCPEPGCFFQGAPKDLLAHLTSRHAMPVDTVRVGMISMLQLPAATERRLLLVEGGEGDDVGRRAAAAGAGVEDDEQEGDHCVGGQ